MMHAKARVSPHRLQPQPFISLFPSPAPPSCCFWPFFVLGENIYKYRHFVVIHRRFVVVSVLLGSGCLCVFAAAGAAWPRGCCKEDNLHVYACTRRHKPRAWQSCRSVICLISYLLYKKIVTRRQGGGAKGAQVDTTCSVDENLEVLSYLFFEVLQLNTRINHLLLPEKNAAGAGKEFDVLQRSTEDRLKQVRFRLVVSHSDLGTLGWMGGDAVVFRGTALSVLLNLFVRTSRRVRSKDQ